MEVGKTVIVPGRLVGDIAAQRGPGAEQQRKKKKRLWVAGVGKRCAPGAERRFIREVHCDVSLPGHGR